METNADSRPPLFLVEGGASDEEVAALTAVLTAVASASAPETAKPRSEWSAPHRRTRVMLPSGPGAWRSSGLPR